MRSKRAPYNIKYDKTGKTFKEHGVLKGFWTDNKFEDIAKLSVEELDKLIDEWLITYQTRQIKRDRSWWYPTVIYDTTPKVKKKRKINTKFNSSFIQKKVI